MKKSNLIIKSLLLLAIMGLFAVTGCKKDKTTTKTGDDYTAATDNSEADISSNDVLNVSDAVSNDYQLTKSAGDTIHFKWYGVNITRIKLGAGKREIIVDFGKKDTITFGTKTRKGQILLYLTGKYYFPGFEDSIVFNNYYVNDKEIQGYHVVKNIGFQSDGYMAWSINVALKITRPDGASHTWNSTRQRELETITTYTDTTKVHWDPTSYFVYKITGSGGGVDSKGVSYTANITSPLIKAFDCWWIGQGSIVFQASGNAAITLDYGDTYNCDDNATVTINGNSYNIILP